MVTGDNKGMTYEKMIVQIMRDKKIIPEGKQGAGGGPGTDITFLHKGSRKANSENAQRKKEGKTSGTKNNQT